jgi:hypothetical protein
MMSVTGEHDSEVTSVATWKAGKPRHQPRQESKKKQVKAKFEGTMRPDKAYHTALKCVDNIALLVLCGLHESSR